MQKEGKMPKFKDTLKPQIVTGLEALGRGQDLNKLNQFLSMLQPLGAEVIASELNIGDYLDRLGASLGIDTQGLVKSEEQKMQEQQQQQEMMMQQQQAQMMEKGIAPASKVWLMWYSKVNLKCKNRLKETIMTDNINTHEEQGESQEHIDAMVAKGEQLEANNNPNKEERPDWLPEKFKTPEDMANAYSNLEKKMGEGQKKKHPKLTMPQKKQQMNNLVVVKYNKQSRLRVLTSMPYNKSIIKGAYQKMLTLS